jgi:hypothetical protein
LVRRDRLPAGRQGDHALHHMKRRVRFPNKNVGLVPRTSRESAIDIYSQKAR